EEQFDGPAVGVDDLARIDLRIQREAFHAIGRQRWDQRRLRTENPAGRRGDPFQGVLIRRGIRGVVDVDANLDVDAGAGPDDVWIDGGDGRARDDGRPLQ